MQFFHNFDPGADIFNHRSATYWDQILPGQVEDPGPSHANTAILTMMVGDGWWFSIKPLA